MRSLLEEKALELLSGNISAEIVAATLGVTPSAISQLISREDFAKELSELKFKKLQKYNERDNEYDKIEDALLVNLKNAVPMMMKPNEVLRGIQIVNAAKRRGTVNGDHVTTTSQTISLSMPTIIVNRFQVNVNNQVVQVGEQSLVTLPSKDLGTLVEEISHDREQQELKQLPTDSASRS